MVLSLEEKLKCMKSLNWDYTTSPEDMLAVLEGRVEKAGPFNQKTLLVRSLERLHWEYVAALWGVEKIKALYTPELSRRIWPKDRRRSLISPLEYYEKNLYPLQDGVLNIISQSGTVFFLTGGTALFDRTDSIQNMLSNKITALFRYAAKDE
jgi:hypothetical protein